MNTTHTKTNRSYLQNYYYVFSLLPFKENIN